MTSPASDHTATSHASDGTLLALIDGERSTELGIAQRHVDQCDICRARRTTLVARSDQVRDSISAIPIPARSEDAFRRRIAARAPSRTPVWRRPGWVGAAAVVVLGAAAAASPVRDWIRSRVERTRAEHVPTPAPGVPESAQPVDRPGTSISFAPTGRAFTVRFDSVPRAGVLSVESTTKSEITARVTSGAAAGGDALVVLPGELGIRNSASSRASYGVSLPQTVHRIRVIIAGRSAFDGPPPAQILLYLPR